jgi:serine/threonine protein kinase
MDLLKAMLQKHPKNRISSADALMHPAFCNVLSKSPLHSKPLEQLDVEGLQIHNDITEKQRKLAKKDKTNTNMIPDDIDEFYSPNTPAYNKNKKKSVDLMAKNKSN